jgi:hypothetical protein
VHSRYPDDQAIADGDHDALPGLVGLARHHAAAVVLLEHCFARDRARGDSDLRHPRVAAEAAESLLHLQRPSAPAKRPAPGSVGEGKSTSSATRDEEVRPVAIGEAARLRHSEPAAAITNPLISPIAQPVRQWFVALIARRLSSIPPGCMTRDEALRPAGNSVSSRGRSRRRAIASKIQPPRPVPGKPDLMPAAQPRSPRATRCPRAHPRAARARRSPRKEADRSTSRAARNGPQTTARTGSAARRRFQA